VNGTTLAHCNLNIVVIFELLSLIAAAAAAAVGTYTKRHLAIAQYFNFCKQQI